MPNKKDENIQSAGEVQFILPDEANFAIDDTEPLAETDVTQALEVENEILKEEADAQVDSETAEQHLTPEAADELTESIALADTQNNASEAIPEESEESDAEKELDSEEEENVSEVPTAPVETKNGLLNVEHFSDYISRSKKSEDDAPETAEENSEDTLKKDNPSEDESEKKSDAEETEEVFSAPAYESMTLLDEKDEDAEEEEKEKPEQKYTDPDREPYDPEKPRKVDARFDFLELFIFTLVAVMIITTFIFRHSVVEGPSMLNTLEEGDHLIISDTFYTPKRGDIVVCQDHETGHTNPVVKRIIAIEGDSIEILANGMVFVNDKLLIEDYVYLDGPDNFQGMPKTVVPEDTVFVMGDHRNLSSDSRTFRSTFVREDAILGKVILRFYPFDKFGSVD